MLFDMRKMLQIVFDPDWHVGHENSVANALCRRRFHPNYRNLSKETLTPARHIHTLQRRMERWLDIEERGLCGILSFLVCLACIRFNYNNTRYMSWMIGNLLRRANKVKSLQLIDWYSTIINTNDPDALRELLFPAPSDEKCNTYSPSSRACCTRPACRQGSDGCTCWQHRYLVRNLDAQNGKCATAQALCL